MNIYFYFQSLQRDLNNKFLCFLLFLLIVFVLFIIYPIYFFESYNGKRQLQVIIFLIFHCLLFFPAILTRYTELILFLPRYIKCLLFFLFLSGVVSSFLSQFYLYSFGDWVHYLLLLNVGFIAYSLFSLYPKVASVLQATILLGFFIILIEFALRCVIAFAIDGYLSPLLIYPNPGNIRFLNQMHVQVFFAFPVLLLISPLYFRKWIMCFAIVGMFMLIIGGARGAIVSILCCIGISALFKNPNLKNINKTSMYIILVGFIVYGFYLYIYIPFLSPKEEVLTIWRSGSSGRLGMWLDAFDVFKANLLGVGPYHYGVVSSEASHSHVHNFLVQVFLEWGLVAGLALIFLVCVLLKVIFTLFTTSVQITTLGLAYSILCGLWYSLFSGVLVMPASQVLFILLLAMLFVKVVPFSSFAVGVNYPYKNIVCSLIAFFLCFYLYYVCESYRLHNLSSVNSGSIGYKSIGPRMWVRGGVVVITKG